MGNRKNPPSVMIGPSTTPLEAPMLDRISTTAMMASMMPKYGEPIDAKRGAGLLKVLEPEGEGMGHPFRSGSRRPPY
ncbi:hypothetical protein StoSoilB22_07040 [Arthrobacter sp. StoSoilB22]|nr:hypothetical protein StoSoilB22_07040 [Arthrobacter sp. StoSoilB22]